MRKEFFDCLYDQMQKDERIIFLTADLGFGLSDNIKSDFPDRFYNVQAAELAMMAIGVGLSLEGRIPFVYSITPFLLWRPAETIRTYVNHESIPIKMIGSGRNKDYERDEFSHDGSDDKAFMQMFPNIKSYWPQHKDEIPDLIEAAINTNKPFYINLKR